MNTTGLRSCYVEGNEGKGIPVALGFSYSHTHYTEMRVMRIFNIYGLRMLPDDGRVESNFIMQTHYGQALTLYGDGSQTVHAVSAIWMIWSRT